MIRIDKISHVNTGAGAAASLTAKLVITSPDAIIVVGFAAVNPTSIKANGIDIPQIVLGGDNRASIYILTTPSVGPVDIVANFSSATAGMTAMSILGASKRSTNFINNKITSAVTNRTITVPVAQAQSMIIDCTGGGTATSPLNDWQTMISTESGAQNVVMSFAIMNPGVQVMGWNDSNAASVSYVAVVLEPDQAPSIWYPTITDRSIYDVTNSQGFATSNLPSGGPPVTSKDYPSQFWRNSFLHTVGRIVRPPSTVLGTLVSETEQETSQIIIDKVFQGQVAAVALSTVTLNMDISIPSPDAVLVVTGGSVIATGAKWASVQFNGNLLTNLVQASVAGADAEIWYLPNPPVGTSTLSIASGTGGEIYANAMVILGIDKRSTNIQVASATDAASTTTIGALITPDAPNSLIIDTMSTLNATTFPVQDASQTQVFNASALAGNEYVLTTYKIASGQQNMNYNLSVAVNAALVAVAFRPTQAASMWFPNIALRQLDDVVTVAGLDSEVNPAFGQYGYKASSFYLNSFLHTIGRLNRSLTPAVSTNIASRMLLGMGM